MKNKKYAYTLSYGDIKTVVNDLIEEGTLKESLSNEELVDIAFRLHDQIDWYGAIHESINHALREKESLKGVRK